MSRPKGGKECPTVCGMAFDFTCIKHFLYRTWHGLFVNIVQCTCTLYMYISVLKAGHVEHLPQCIFL